MRCLTLLLLASLRLCSARQPGFSVDDDLLAYPQVSAARSHLLAHPSKDRC